MFQGLNTKQWNKFKWHNKNNIEVIWIKYKIWWHRKFVPKCFGLNNLGFEIDKAN